MYIWRKIKHIISVLIVIGSVIWMFYKTHLTLCETCPVYLGISTKVAELWITELMPWFMYNLDKLLRLNSYPFDYIQPRSLQEAMTSAVPAYIYVKKARGLYYWDPFYVLVVSLIILIIAALQWNYAHKYLSDESYSVRAVMYFSAYLSVMTMSYFIWEWTVVSETGSFFLGILSNSLHAKTLVESRQMRLIFVWMVLELSYMLVASIYKRPVLWSHRLFWLTVLVFFLLQNLF